MNMAPERWRYTCSSTQEKAKNHISPFAALFLHEKDLKREAAGAQTLAWVSQKTEM